jgi:hypothetical protein
MLNQPSQPTNQYANLTENELRQAFLAAANGNNLDAANRFFDQFKYKNDLFDGNAAAALNQGLDLLNRCHSIDPDAFANIHKGTAYYWIGIAAFLVHEIELATFFFDAAVVEDIRAGAHPINNPTPAIRFILIEGEPPEQAARQLVQVTQARTEELIANYNARPGRSAGAAPLTIADIRERFLRPAITPGRENLRSSATAFISFNMEWDFRNLLFDIRPVQGTAEPFFLHLFKGCVLFESLLKGNTINPLALNSALGNALRHLHTELGIPAHNNIGNTDFPTIIADLVGADDSVQTAIQFTGRIRNTLGHNLGWVVPLDKVSYHCLFRMVSSSCLHAISCLYP